MAPEAKLYHMKCKTCFECPCCQCVMALRAVTQAGEDGAGAAASPSSSDKVCAGNWGCGENILRKLLFDVNRNEFQCRYVRLFWIRGLILHWGFG